MTKGYKAFHKNMYNRYGEQFEEGKTYSVKGPLQFGNSGNGIHFCKRLEDTLRYVPAMEEAIEVAAVTSIGEKIQRDDEYYGYYDLFAARKIKIDHILKREEIIKMFLDVHMPPDRVKRFVSSYLLTKEEIELFKIVYATDEDIIKAILYYQEGDKDVYKRDNKIKKKGTVYDRLS